MGEFVDVTGAVALGEIAAVVLALQRGFNGAHFVGCHGTALQPACGQQFGDFARVVKPGLVAVNVQDALALEVKVNALGLCPTEQVLPCLNGQAGGGDGVVAVFGNVGHEFGHPAQFVPAGFGVHQQRRVGLQHPFDAFDQGGRVRPDLGIGRRQLPAVGIAGFHARVAVFFDQGDAVALFGQGVGAGDTGDAAANDDEVLLCHGESRFQGRQTKETQPAHRVPTMTPSVWNLRDSPAPAVCTGLACSCGGFGDESKPLFRVLKARQSVLLPESFRGGCSFGAGLFGPVSPD